MKKPPDLHHHHHFPADLISHGVWLYHVFSLSLRDVQLLLTERGIIVSYESIRRWCLTFGSVFTDNLRRRRRLLEGLQHRPRVLVTDKLKSYGVAKREVLPDVEHRESHYLTPREPIPTHGNDVCNRAVGTGWLELMRCSQHRPS